MQQVKIAAISLASFPGAKAENLVQIESWSKKAAVQGANLACFPAMAVTGFWQGSEVCHHAEILKTDLVNPAIFHDVGPSVKSLGEIAKSLALHLAAGIVEDLDFYHLRNSVSLFGPDGHLGTAAEMHTPIAAHSTYFGARECRVFHLGEYTLGILVGEDLLFPEVARMLVVQGAQLLIACLCSPLGDEPDALASWRNQLSHLLAARAIENGVCVIAVDSAGSVMHPVDKTTYQFSGQAMAFDARGQQVAMSPANNEEKLLLVDLELPARPCERLARRRPFLYQPLSFEKKATDVPGTREADWDAQGEIIWSRLRDLGFFGADLYAGQERSFCPQHRAVVVTGPSLPPLTDYRAVVLTRPCLAHLALREAEKLPDWVNSGGTLVLDGYCGRNSEIFDTLSGKPGPLRREIHIPSYDDASSQTVRIQIAESDPIFNGMEMHRAPKVWGQIWLPNSRSQDSELEAARRSSSSRDTPFVRTLMNFISPEGQKLGPGLYHNTCGEGQVYTFTYSLGYSQLLLMEGRGTLTDLGSFPQRVALDVPRDGDVNTWGDQVVTDAEDQFFPSADYHVIPLLSILLAAIDEHLLVSPVPFDKECGVIFTGDSDRANSDAINEYTAILARHGIRPTQFILRGDYNARTLDPECEYGIHPLFHETERECFDVLVSYGFNPAQLVCGRRHCLVQYGLTQTLERMAECGVRFTSNNWSFPYPETLSTALLYGTALPHHIYNWEGRRIGIVDIPQVFMDYAPILACARAAYHDVRRTHGVGAWNFHPQNFALPGMIDAIEWLAGQVAHDDAWCGTMGQFGQWYLQRDRVELRCEGSQVTLQGEWPAGLTLLSPHEELSINGELSQAVKSSSWYGRNYWVHVMAAEAAVPVAPQLAG